MDRLFSDIHHAVRSLRRTPGFAIAVLLILALAIGMSTAMFTIFKTVLVDRLPITAQDRVVIMHTLDRSGRNLDVPGTYLSAIAHDSTLVSGVAGVYHRVVPWPLMNGSAVVAFNVAGTSANYFDVLGAHPALGRLLRPEDGQPGAPTVLVLSYAVWQRDFGGDSSVVDRWFVMPWTQKGARVVGVTPPGLAYPSGAEAWTAITPEQSWLQVDIVARLAPHATINAARDGIFALTQRLNPFAGAPPAVSTTPLSFNISGVAAQSFADTVLGSSRPSIVALTVAVALLLLIACVNVGNLSLVRLLGRTREVAVRRAIGARPFDIVRLFAVENTLLGTLGGALGFLTAVAALRVVRAAAPPQVPRLDALDSLVAPLTAAAGITFFALLLFGVLPSFVASRIQSYTVLRSDSRSGAEGRSARRARQWLVAMQIALAVVMLNGAGLLVRTLAQLEAVDLGYRAEHLSFLSLTAPEGAVPSGIASDEAGRQLVRRVEALPGVTAATPILNEPFIGQSLYIMKVARVEQPVTERQQDPFVPFEFVGPDYFRTLAIPILRGRGFTEAETPGSARVVVVNETLARQLWPNDDALGKRVVLMNGPTHDTTYTVIGVASNTRFRELKNVGPVAYFAWGGFPDLLAVRTSRPLAAMLPPVRAVLREVNPALVLWKTHTMDQLLDAPLAQPRLSALLLSGFSLVALLLSAVGLYGVMAAGVRRQTHDIGVRMALGAMPGAIRRLVLTQVVGLVGVGVIAGLAGALATSRVLRSMLFDVSPIDPPTLAGVCVLLLAAATLAGYLPVRRAARIDPVEALRAE
jgi:putative ABC transport system permease protein